jgi:hypothetical protein
MEPKQPTVDPEPRADTSPLDGTPWRLTDHVTPGADGNRVMGTGADPRGRCTTRW